LAIADFGEIAGGSLDARFGGQRLREEPLAFDRDLVALVHAPLAMPGLLSIGPGLDHLVPEQEPHGERDLDLPLLHGPEIGEALFDLRELQCLVLLVALMMRLGLIELPEDREERGPNGVLSSVRRLRGPI
jgi:hypothetical protein